uniref:Alpha-amylase n=1 Tax=Rhabditophanes sp. KR3021 TaxID=114890 RepID=A0AC35U1S7_9BILA
MLLLHFLLFFLIPFVYSYNVYWYDKLETGDKQSIVHLFEWKWVDVAAECETFLSKYGYGAVQVSPPMEHIRVVQNNNLPWWIRYQPTSYKLDSRSGNEAQFIDMVNRCNKVGVRIIVDVVINHMTGVGQKSGSKGVSSSGSSTFDATDGVESFPAIPYTAANTNDARCHGDIQGSDYQNSAYHVKECRLVGLIDLNQNDTYVQSKLITYLNKYITIGVAGFRFDASKHMWPNDLITILNGLNDLNANIFGPNKRPFAVHEVIDRGGEAVKCGDYLNCGRYTNFNYGAAVSQAARSQRGWDDLAKLGPGFEYGNNEDHDILAFIDNHDNQRDPSPYVVTHKDGNKYTLAVSFMLAWPYGLPRVMSSYYFSQSDQGPPTTASNFATSSPSFDSSHQCTKQSGWVCEHRWPQIRRMSNFRKSVEGAAAAVIFTSNNVLSFARANKGYFAINGNNSPFTFNNVDTTLDVGIYCDIYNSDFKEGDNCIGTKVVVYSNGKATFTVPPNSVVAFTVETRVGGPPQTSSPPASYQKTTIFIKRQTNIGQDVFIRGGSGNGDGCLTKPFTQSSDPCALPIYHNWKVSKWYDEYLSWHQNDLYLDWQGPELSQGTHDGIIASGTPLIYTTNDQTKPEYQPLNKYGPNYWMVEVFMDCTKTQNNWFELKAYEDNGVGWEGDINQERCGGSVGGTAPSKTNNHMGQCGFVNVFEWDTNSCLVQSY